MEPSEARLPKTIKQRSNNPNKDADLSTLSLAIAAKWKTSPHITLVWISQPEYESKVSEFGKALSTRQITGSGRRELTARLKTLDHEINQGISALKAYLAYKYEKANAPSYYPQFGIVKKGTNYLLPGDRSKRLAALQLIPHAVAVHEFGDEKYGTAFWQRVTDSYQALLEKTTNIDGTVSVKVSAKNELRKTLVETHNALVHVLKGNYPRSWKAVLREWGFQKEKY